MDRPATRRRVLVTVARVLGVASLAWFAVLAGLPGVRASPAALWATGAFLLVNLVVSFVGLYRARRLFLLHSLGLIALLAIVHLQVHDTLGEAHYRSDRPPQWTDWLVFIGAHMLRAADALDFLEAYGINLQSLHHAGALSGGLLVALHLCLGLFLFGVVFDLVPGPLRNLSRPLRRFTRTRSDLMVDIIMAALFVLVVSLIWMVGAAIVQGWPWYDWLLWPLDNVLRVLDFPDLMQIADWRLHGVPRTFWNSTLAFTFRLPIAILLVGFLRLVIVAFFPSLFPWNVKTIVQTLLSDNPHIEWADFMAELTARLPADVQEEVVQGALARFREPCLEERDVPSEALVALAESGVWVAGALLPLLHDPTPDLPRRTVEVLGQCFLAGRTAAEGMEGLDTFEEALAGLLAEDAPEVREAAARALGRVYQHTGMLGWWVVAFRRSDESEPLTEMDVAWNALEGALRASRALPRLVEVLAEATEPWVRREAAIALGAIYEALGDGPAVPALVARLEGDDSADVQFAALDALKQIRPQGAVPALLRLLRDPRDYGRLRAVEALLEIDPEQGTTVLPVLLHLVEGESEEAASAAYFLGQVRPVVPDAVTALVRRLKRGDVRSRRDAVVGLGNMGLDGGPALPALVALLNARDEGLREEAVQAVGKIAPLSQAGRQHLKPLQAIQACLAHATAIGDRAWTLGDYRGCYEVYAATARMLLRTVSGAREAHRQLQRGLDGCAGAREDQRASALGACFVAITYPLPIQMARGGELRVFLHQALLLADAASNAGDGRGAAEIYACAARMLLRTRAGDESARRAWQQALERCDQVRGPTEQARTMRHAFTTILDATGTSTRGHP